MDETLLQNLLGINTYAFSKPIRDIKRTKKLALLTEYYYNNEERINAKFNVTDINGFFNTLKEEEE